MGVQAVHSALSETKLFYFHGIFKKDEMKSEKRTPVPLYI